MRRVLLHTPIQQLQFGCVHWLFSHVRLLYLRPCSVASIRVLASFNNAASCAACLVAVRHQFHVARLGLFASVLFHR